MTAHRPFMQYIRKQSQLSASAIGKALTAAFLSLTAADMGACYNDACCLSYSPPLWLYSYDTVPCQGIAFTTNGMWLPDGLARSAEPSPDGGQNSCHHYASATDVLSNHIDKITHGKGCSNTQVVRRFARARDHLDSRQSARSGCGGCGCWWRHCPKRTAAPPCPVHRWLCAARSRLW